MGNGKRHRLKLLFGFVWCLVFSSACQLAAIAPTRMLHSHVAGNGTEGDVDGTFLESEFSEPSGLLFDAATNSILVADKGNGKLKRVFLDEKNRVESIRLRFSGNNGLKSPVSLAWVSEGLVAVADPGAANIALVNLKTGDGRWLIDEEARQHLKINLNKLSSVVCGTGYVIVAAKDSGTILVGLKDEEYSWHTAAISGIKGGIDDLSVIGNQLFVLSSGKSQNAVLKVVFPKGPMKDALGGVMESLNVSLTAQALVPKGLNNPFGFVRTEGLKFICGSVSLCAECVNEANCTSLPVIDIEGRALGIDDNAFFNNKRQVIGNSVMGPRALWLSARYACENKESGYWYISIPEGNRIVSVRPLDIANQAYDKGIDGFYDYPHTVKPGRHIRRIAVNGASTWFYPTDSEKTADSFSKRLEYYLNLFASMKELDDQYEAVFVGEKNGTGSGTSVWTRLIASREKLTSKLNPDVLLLCITPADFFWVIPDFSDRKLDAAGLPSLNFDPEYALGLDRHGVDLPKGDYKNLYDYLWKLPGRSKSLLVALPNGRINVDLSRRANCFSKTEFDSDLIEKMGPLLHALFVKVIKEFRHTEIDQGKGVEVKVLYMPFRDFLGPQEMEGQFRAPDATIARRKIKDWCSQESVEFIDISDEMYQYSLDTGHVWENDHMNKQGHNLAGLVSALRYLDNQNKSGLQGGRGSNHGSK